MKTNYFNNIFYMLTYVYSEFKVISNDEYNYEKFDNTHEFMIYLLFKLFKLRLKKGLYKNYREVIENVPTIIGNLNMDETFKNDINRKKLINCTFDEFTENNIYNQIIKSVLVNFVNKNNNKKFPKEEIVELISNLHYVDIISLKNIEWKLLTYSGINKDYLILHNVCYFIINNYILTTDKNKYKFNGFQDFNEAALYEKFILNYYIKHYPTLNVSAETLKDTIKGDTDKIPIMRTDITIKSDNKILVIDAKYYTKIFNERYDKEKVKSENIYQMFTYVKNMEVKYPGKEVSGMLLYGKTTQDYFDPINITMTGNSISFDNLDLNGTITNLENKLDSIIENYFNIEKRL